MENPKPRSCDPPGLFSKRATAMNNSDLDQADEEILTYAVSDEARRRRSQRALEFG
jgi:hypothetical protein